MDTDVLIWYLRGNSKAKALIHTVDNFAISAITYMELIQGMRNKKELNIFKKFIHSLDLKIIHINESISSRATLYVEENYLSHSLTLADSLIGATCTTYGLTLITANEKHYRCIPNISIERFRP